MGRASVTKITVLTAMDFTWIDIYSQAGSILSGASSFFLFLFQTCQVSFLSCFRTRERTMNQRGDRRDKGANSARLSDE